MVSGEFDHEKITMTNSEAADILRWSVRQMEGKRFRIQGDMVTAMIKAIQVLEKTPDEKE